MPTLLDNVIEALTEFNKTPADVKEVSVITRAYVEKGTWEDFKKLAETALAEPAINLYIWGDTWVLKREAVFSEYDDNDTWGFHLIWEPGTGPLTLKGITGT